MINLRSKLLKVWNFWPPFLFAGIRIRQVSGDFRHLVVGLKLRFWNANYVGTQYGGSIFSMADPFYMVMLMKNLGPDFVVWDKSAAIFYLRPGRTDLTAEFILSEKDLTEIHKALETEKSLDWPREIEIKDTAGLVVAKVSKLLYIRKRTH